MTKTTQLRTAADFKQHLANQLEGLQNGTVSTEMANTVVRVTDGIANMINAEIKLIQHSGPITVPFGQTDMIGAPSIDKAAREVHIRETIDRLPATTREAALKSEGLVA